MPRTQGLTALAVLHHVTAALALLSMIDLAQHPDSTGSMIVFAMQVAAFAFFSVIVRRGWASIDGGAQGLSPAKAQGFLFIPFFNFYWIFPALVSLATQTNAKADAEKVSGATLTRGFGLVIAILFCVTSLTNLHASLAWLHFIVYATYLGFATTYIWQIRRSAAAFDISSAPALREPAKMPTVGVAGIIYGSALAGALLVSLLTLMTAAPKSIAELTSQAQAKGYRSKIDDRSFGRYQSALERAGVRGQVNEVLLYGQDGSKHAGVYVIEGEFSQSSEEIIQRTLQTKTLRTGNLIYFNAYLMNPPQNHVDVLDWLKSL